LSGFRYKAFISYSHQDESWGRWLQRALERYRVPRHLAGKEGKYGTIPARLSPVFRDREDLSTSADLGHSISQELDLSESLIVVCSPASARSRWVNEEILHFRSLGRGDRIHALIVNGDPGATDPSEYCFPPALTAQEDGSQSEPLAADVRKWADGKLLATLKLISAILGIRLDDLRRRDMQRRHRLWMASSLTALLVALVTSVLAIMAVNARNAAENRREHAEDLVGYMVGDLREKLATVGRLDILDSMGGEVTDYLETLDPGEVTDESLNQQAKVWRQLGEVSREQGNLKDAMEAFTRSKNVLAELYRRQPDNTDRLFELGQAEFWIGYVSSDLGDLERADRAFTRYLDVSRELLNRQPGNAIWTMEMSYALANMGWLESFREGSDPDKILNYMESALDYNRKALMLDPENTDIRVSLTDAHADLADAYMGSCNLGAALINRLRNVELATEFHQGNPGDSKLKQDLAYARSGLGSVQRQVGLVEQSLASLRESELILSELSGQDPSNLNYQWQRIMRSSRMASIRANTGEQQNALAVMEESHSAYRPAVRS
jgi:tetratricopeptide (TPR) repeat protein